MAVSIQSSQKIKYFQEGIELIRGSRLKLSGAMQDSRQVADVIGMAAMDRSYNGMAVIAEGFNNLLDQTHTAFLGVATALAEKAGLVGPEFKTQINSIVGDLESLPKAENFPIKAESSGMDDNMDDASRAKFEDAIDAVMDVRYNYIITLSEITSGCMADPDFSGIMVKLGAASEEFTNGTLLTTFNSIKESLEALGISMDKRLEDMQAAGAAVTRAEMSGVVPDIMEV